MENVVNVKAFLTKSSEDSEIRRFTLDHEVATNFEYLRGKISTIFPTLTRQEFIVYWKDDEGDMVRISSDEELVQALTFGTHGDLFRLTIQNVSEASVQPEGGSGTQRARANQEHPGITCDACEGGIVGLRFKCLVCPDYDLCETCCDQGLHNQHYLLRMATPAAPEFHGPRGPRCERQGMQNPWWANFQGVGPWGGNMRRWWRNIMRQQQMQGNDEQTNTRAEGAPPQGTTESNPEPQVAPNSDEEQREYLEHVGHQVQAILEPLGINVDVDIENRPNPSIRRRWQGQGRGCTRQPCANNGTCKPDGQCRRKKCAQSGPCKPDTNCKKAGKCAKDPNADGPQVCPISASAPQVEPMEVKVVNTPKRPEIAPLVDLTSDGQAAAASAPPQTMEVHTADEEGQSWVKVEPIVKDMDVVEVNKPAEQQPNPSTSILYPSLTSLNAAASASAPAPFVYLAQSAVSQAPSSDASAALHSIPDSTLPSKLVETEPQTSGQAQASDGVSEAITEMDRKVAEAIEQMRTMGFHDEGGWMTALLYQHQGDIYKVIDTVLRMAQNQQKQ